MTRGFKDHLSTKDVGLPTLLASLSLNILALLTPLIILLIFDRVIPFQSNETLSMLALLMVGALIFEFALRWCRTVMMTSLSERLALQNYTHFLKTVLTTNPNAFGQSSNARHLERFHAIAALRDFFASPNQTLAIDLPFTILFAIMIALIGGWLVLVPLGALVAVATFALVMKYQQASLFEDRKTIDDRRYSFLSEVLSRMTTVKSNTMERQVTRRYELLCKQSVETSQRLILFSGLSQSYGAVIAQCATAGTGLLGAFLVIRGQIGIAEMAACMLLSGRIIQPILKLLSFWVQSEAVAAARLKLAEMTALETGWQKPARATAPLQGSFSFAGVAAAAPTTAGAAFENLTASLDPGDIALFDAADPEAVQALFSVVLGQAETLSGQLLIDGHSPLERTTDRGENGIVALERDTALFSGTLMENLSAFGGAEAVERARYFSGVLGLDDRVKRLPAGYNTQLGGASPFERDGVNRQLVALVRVLALKPRVLLMNQPTRVLDTKDRKTVCACLAALDPMPTILMASPDPRLRGIATRRFELETQSGADVAQWALDAQIDGEQRENVGAA